MYILPLYAKLRSIVTGKWSDAVSNASNKSLLSKHSGSLNGCHIFHTGVADFARLGDIIIKSSRAFRYVLVL